MIITNEISKFSFFRLFSLAFDCIKKKIIDFFFKQKQKLFDYEVR